MPRLGVGGVALDVRELVSLEVHTSGGAEDVLLEVGQRIQDRLRLRGLAAVEVVDDVESGAHGLELGDERVGLLAVGSDVLDFRLVLLVGGVGVVRNLLRDGGLASGQQGDVVAGLDEVAGQVDADEAGPSQD